MRRKTAREVLADSFRELARVKPIDKITVRDIIEDSGYSQAAFYRQFRDKYDLIAWSYTRGLETILDQVKGDVQSWRQTLTDAAVYCRKHQVRFAACCAVLSSSGKKALLIASGMASNIIRTTVSAGVMLSFSSHSRVMPTAPWQYRRIQYCSLVWRRRTRRVV